MRRIDCLRAIAPLVADQLVVSTNGSTVAEWEATGPVEGHLQVKTLGLCSSIALGLALALPRRKVIAFDGDGSLLMNLCGLPTIAHQRPPNLLHVVFDNGVYEASGGTATQTASGTDLAALARGAGYANVRTVDTLEAFQTSFAEALRGAALAFLHARVAPGRDPVPPLAVGEVENKYRLIRYVERTEGITILTGKAPASWKPVP
jgi:thiamine pyrophosphate-dependent acetolactate synthase large subunit-like protein